MRKRTLIEYALVILISFGIVFFFAHITNTMPAKWDGVYYVDMAKNGIIGNANLVAPFAYRPGMPLLAHLVSSLLSVTVERGFQLLGYLALMGLLFAVYLLAKEFTKNFGQAIIPVFIVALLGIHSKFPLFFFTLVDVCAYPFIVFAVWAFIRKKYFLCLAISVVGLLFKEFLVIPIVLLLVHFGMAYWRGKGWKNLVSFFLVLAVGAGMIILPRLLIPVSSTLQEVDPVNNLSTLKNLWTNPFDELRLVNVFFSILSYWLPTLLLLNTSRFKDAWNELEHLRIYIIVYLIMILLFSIYGGTNILVFVSYSVPIQVIFLSVILKNKVHLSEMVLVFAVLMTYNKIFLEVPLPAKNLDAYLDFYGGWSTRVNITTIARTFEIAVFLFLGNAMRFFIQMSKDK